MRPGSKMTLRWWMAQVALLASVLALVRAPDPISFHGRFIAPWLLLFHLPFYIALVLRGRESEGVAFCCAAALVLGLISAALSVFMW